MTALKILGTALKGIFADFGQTLRIFALPGLLIMLTVAAMLWFSLSRNSILLDLLFALAVITTLVSSLWSAVNFHRHILLGERFGWLPRLHGRAVLGYGLMMIPMGLVLFGCLVGLTYLLPKIYMKILTGPPDSNPYLKLMVITLIASTCITALALRLFSLLPALAIGAPLRGYRGGPLRGLSTIIPIALILSALQMAYYIARPMITMLAFKVSGAIPVVDMVNALLAVITMVMPIFTISLLTALYATYVGKPAPGD